MAKRRRRVHFRLPPYVSPRNAWRRLIHEAAREQMESRRFAYRDDDALEVSVVLYLDGAALRFHDVDNRLKDVLDALQGRLGGATTGRLHDALIPNDRQVYKVTVTKMRPPKQSRGLGHVTVTRFRIHNDDAP